jgi:hypothetical protein
MQAKSIGIFLDVVGVISVAAFIVMVILNQIIGIGSGLKGFALSWLFVYVFAATLGFRGSLDSHKDALRRFLTEWIVACLVGVLLTLFVLLVG